VKLPGMTVVRFLLEAGFVVLVAAAAGLAELGWVWIALVMFCAWVLVAVVERSEGRTGDGAGNERGARGRRAARSPRFDPA